MTDSKKMAKIAYEALDSKKGEDIKILEIGTISVLADYFIIASGDNTLQIQAMVNEVQDRLGKEGFSMKRLEGTKGSSWMLLDYGDLVVHVFNKEDRLFYDLERIWSDGTLVQPEELDK